MHQSTEVEAVSFVAARSVVLIVGWSFSLGFALPSGTCEGTNCIQSMPEPSPAKASAVFWTTSAIAGGIALADVATQLVVGHSLASRLSAHAHLAPAMLRAPEGKQAPGVALAGSF
jgi:hypothetical protein